MPFKYIRLKIMRRIKKIMSRSVKLNLRHFRVLWLFTILSIICSACTISPKISPEILIPDTQKSQTVSYKAPQHPFTITQSDSADRAWINPATGSIISYQSICNESLDPNLETILQKFTSDLANKNFLKRTSMQYNGRQSERVLVSGQLDGIAVHLEFVFFKKNSCSYTLSFISLPEHFDKGTDAFNNFIKGFTVQ